MRFFGLALASSALVLGACGGDKGAGNAAESAAADSVANAAAVATPGAGTEGALAMAPATGTIHEVKMLVDPNDPSVFKFEPANITIKQGDGVKWTMVSGGPHNVQFDEATVPAAAKPQLRANMPNMAAELASPMMFNPNETYQISFANVPAGTYNYVCQPHIAMNMKGVVTVQ